MDPDQTEQSDQGPHCLAVCKNRFEKFARIFSRQHKQKTFLDAGFLDILRVNRGRFRGSSCCSVEPPNQHKISFFIGNF